MATICPICEAQAERLFCVDGYWIRHCAACRHCFADVAFPDVSVEAIYDDHYFFGGGAGYSNYLEEEEILIAHGRYYSRLLRPYLKGGSVFDVGTAAGFLLHAFRRRGWEGHGIEPNDRMANYARARFGLDVRTGTLEQLVTDEVFDLVTLIQVAGHFRDIRQAFRVAATIARPGGYLLVETWNHRSVTARVLGRRWHEWSPPSVLHWFSRESLTALTRQLGLQVVATGRPKKRISLQHTRSLLQHKMGSSGFAGFALGALNLPALGQLAIPYPGEDLFWLLLRKTQTVGSPSYVRSGYHSRGRGHSVSAKLAK